MDGIYDVLIWSTDRFAGTTGTCVATYLEPFFNELIFPQWYSFNIFRGHIVVQIQ